MSLLWAAFLVPPTLVGLAVGMAAKVALFGRFRVAHPAVWIDVGRPWPSVYGIGEPATDEERRLSAESDLPPPQLLPLSWPFTFWWGLPRGVRHDWWCRMLWWLWIVSFGVGHLCLVAVAVALLS